MAHHLFRHTFRLVDEHGFETTYRTRRRILMGDHLPIADGIARVVGMGWEGDTFYLNVREVTP